MATSVFHISTVNTNFLQTTRCSFQLDFASGQVIVPKTLDVNVYVPPKLEAGLPKCCTGHDMMGE